jgi:hypothetical protein
MTAFVPAQPVEIAGVFKALKIAAQVIRLTPE